MVCVLVFGVLLVAKLVAASEKLLKNLVMTFFWSSSQVWPVFL